MRRAILSLLSLACVALMCVLAANCGSSGSSRSGGPYNVVGTWESDLSGSIGTAVFAGAIDSQGTTLLFAINNPNAVGDTWQLPTITGASSFSGETTLYAAPGTQLPDGGGSSQSVSIQGTVNSDTLITVTNSNGKFSLSAENLLIGSSVSALSGAMTGVINDGTQDGPSFPLVFTPTSSGSNQSMSFVTSGTATCSVSGSFTQVGTANVFDVSMTFSGVCPVSSGTQLSGLGFESSTDYFNDNAGQAGTYLYADALASTGPFAMEIFK